MKTVTVNSEESAAVYRMDAFCSNCLKPVILRIEKGTRVVEHLRNRECPNCGCANTLKKGKYA